MTDDQVIFHAARLQAQWPYLKAMDWRILGAIIGFGEDGMPLAYVRKNMDFYGSMTSFIPAAERLADAGLIVRVEIEVPHQYKGKEGRKDRIEVYYKRTAKPFIEEAQWVL